MSREGIALAVTLAVMALLLGVGVVVLAFVLPRRIAQMISAERDRAREKAVEAQGAVHEAIKSEVASAVHDLRALLTERERQVLAAQADVAPALRELLTELIATREQQILVAHLSAQAQILVPLRLLLEWGFSYAEALGLPQKEAGEALPAALPQHDAPTLPPSTRAAPSTIPKADRPPAPSRERPTTHGSLPAVLPLRAAEEDPPDPARAAMGFTRPHFAEHRAQAGVPTVPGVGRAAPERSQPATIAGARSISGRELSDRGQTAPSPGPAPQPGERRRFSTLPSMPVQGQPRAREFASVTVSDRKGDGGVTPVQRDGAGGAG